MTHLFDILESECETTLVAEVILLAALVLNIVARELVDCVVCQVHVQVVKIVLVR